MKTKAEILEETIQHYSNTKNRAKTFSTCLYITEDNRKCAVGRCMTEEALGTVQNFEGDVYDVACEFGENYELDALLKEEYKGHEEYFWSNLQSLHDRDNMWEETGLSAEGKEYVEHIKTKFDIK